MMVDALFKTKFTNLHQSKNYELEGEYSLTFKQLIELIFRQPIKQYDYLAIPLTSINDFIQHLSTQKLQYKKRYIKMISYYLGKIVIESFQKGYLEYFIRWLIESESNLLSHIKKYLIEGFTRLLSQNNLLINMTQIDRNVLVLNINESLLLMENSIACDGRCSICEEKFELERGKYNEEGLLFSCGHLFHRNCIE